MGGKKTFLSWRKECPSCNIFYLLSCSLEVMSSIFGLQSCIFKQVIHQGSRGAARPVSVQWIATLPLGAGSPSLGAAASPEGLQGSQRHLPPATQSRTACFLSHQLSSVELIHLSSILAGICCSQLFPKPVLVCCSCMLRVMQGRVYSSPC